MQEEQSELMETIEGLSRPEHLLVWALRAIAVGHGECPLLDQTFHAVCGRRGGECLATYFALVRFVGNCARRPLRLHAPGCPRVSHDERAVVGLVAAAQASLGDQDPTLLWMRLAYLLEDHAQIAGFAAARAVAEVIENAGHTLPVRAHLDQPVRSASRAGLRMVH